MNGYSRSTIWTRHWYFGNNKKSIYVTKSKKPLRWKTNIFSIAKKKVERSKLLFLHFDRNLFLIPWRTFCAIFNVQIFAKCHYKKSLLWEWFVVKFPKKWSSSYILFAKLSSDVPTYSVIILRWSNKKKKIIQNFLKHVHRK